MDTKIDKIFKITAYVKYLDFMGNIRGNNYSKYIDNIKGISLQYSGGYYIKKPIHNKFEYGSTEYKEQEEKNDSYFVDLDNTKYHIWLHNNYIKICSLEEIDQAIIELEDTYKNILPKGDKLIEQMLKIMILTK